MNPKICQLPLFTREEFLRHIKLGHFQSVIIPTGSTEQHLNHLSMWI